MKRGFRIADAYVEIHADESDLRQGIRDIPASMGADADRAGQALGDKLTKGLAAKVEALSGRLANARLQEKKAADAVTLAESRLNQARQKGESDGTKLIALEQKLSQAQDRLTVAHDRTTKATKAQSEAEKLLGRAMEDVAKHAGKDAEKAGEDAGSKLAIGMRMSFIRNSPLIVAAVGGALIAGAPLMLAAAGLLFGGIGALALKNNAQVQASFMALWTKVRTGTVSAAQSLVPVMTGVANSLGHSFDRLQPMLAQAFAASGPLVDKTVTGIERLAENSMPGLLHAVQAGGPVFTGFENFLASTGTGLGHFFDLIAQHGPASGAVFTALGSILQSLLSILGDLTAQGAEVGGVVLPMLATALHVVADVLHVIAPILPAIVMGFTAFKIAQTAAGWLDTFSGKLAAAARQGVPFSGAIGKAGSAASGLAGVMPVVGTALAAVGMIIQAAQRQVDDWAAALLQGGSAAAKATAEMNATSAAGKTMSTGFLGFASNVFGLGGAMDVAAASTDKAKQKMAEMLANMDPLTRAQTLATKAQNDLASAVHDFGPNSDEATAAAHRYATQSGEVTRLQDQESMAINGVTQAMVDQANQILAQTDASLALAKGTDDLTKLAAAAATAIHKYGAGSNEAALAQDALTNGLQSQVHLLETYATSSVPKSLDAMSAGQLAAIRMADGLNALHDKYGNLGTAMEKERADLNAQVSLYDRNRVEAAALAAAFKDTGLAVAAIPGTKTVKITAPTSAAIAELKTLGFTVTKLPNGDVTVSADTEKARGNLNALAGYINQVGGMKPSVTPAVNPGPAIANTHMVMDNLSAMGGMRPVAVADVNTAPARGNYNVMMGMLGTIAGQRPNPVATLGWSTWGAENAINYAARPRYSTIYVTEVSSGYHISGGNGPGGTTLRSSGGPVGRMARVIRAATGRVVGPGTGTSDSVAAMGPGGTRYALSAGEFITREAITRAQGLRKMTMLNEGKATIVPLDPPRPRSTTGGGGSPMASPNPTSGIAPAGGDGGRTITIENLNVAVQGVLDLTNPASARKIAVPIRDAIRRVEMEDR